MNVTAPPGAPSYRTEEQKNTADTLFQMRKEKDSGTKKEADSEGICGQ